MSEHSAESVAVEEMEKWVQDHGSSRLQKAALAGLLENCWTLYREERLALERSGWTYLAKGFQIKKILNPTEDKIDALLDARENWPTVNLVWLQPKDLPGEAWLVDGFLDRTVGIAVDDFAAQFDGRDDG